MAGPVHGCGADLGTVVRGAAAVLLRLLAVLPTIIRLWKVGCISGNSCQSLGCLQTEKGTKLEWILKN